MTHRDVSITAEFVSIMRLKHDSRHAYFVSTTTMRLYKLLRLLVPDTTLQRIFDWRLRISSIIDRKIEVFGPTQILELGCGYSLRGFNHCLKNSSVTYVDSDTAPVIAKKKRVLKTICEKEHITLPTKYHLIDIDVLQDSMSGKISHLFAPEEKTLLIAEGLTPYFTDTEFVTFIEYVRSFLKTYACAELYTHASLSKPSGIVYKLLRRFVTLLTRTRRSRNFVSATDFETYLSAHRISAVKLDTDNTEYLFFTVGHE